MDSLITAAGDPLDALNRVALRRRACAFSERRTLSEHEWKDPATPPDDDPEG
jgi:hypothetical protein